MPSGIEYPYYHGNPITVLQTQIGKVQGSAVKAENGLALCLSDPFDAKLNRNLLPKAEKFMKARSDRNVTCNMRKREQEVSHLLECYSSSVRSLKSLSQPIRLIFIHYMQLC